MPYQGESMIPRYAHDCEICEFKGQFGAFDVYYCSRCDDGTWIARASSEGSDYASYPIFVLLPLFARNRQAESSALMAIAHAIGGIY
jgi:hypothetical protein